MKIIKNNIYILRLLWKASPSRVILNLSIYLIWRMNGILYNIFLMRQIMKAIENDAGMTHVMIILGLILAYSLTASIFNNWFNNYYIPRSDAVIQEYLFSRVYQKAVECDLACYENPEFYDKYTRANSELMTRGATVLDNLSNMAAIFTTMLVCVCVILRWEPAAVPIVAVCAVGATLIDKKRASKRYDAMKEATPYVRQCDYVKRTLYLADYAKEIRLGKIFFPLLSYFDEAVKRQLDINHKHYTIVGALRVLREVFMSIGAYLAVQGLIVYRYIAFRAYDLSDVVTIINAAGTLQSSIYSFTWNLSDFMDNGLYAENIREFLEYEPKIKEDENAKPVKKGANHITLKNVSFRYEGRDNDILKNINIDIPPGRKIAFVGHNGAGKTTLAKLLMRLYDVTGGEILLDGTDIRDYRLSEYRKVYSAVFQDFKIFASTIAENVLLHPPENDEDRERAIQAVKDSGLYSRTEHLEKGMDTLLTKEFDDDGIIMSGGEFQKLAVARVFANKNSSVAILDEPSSALDPISEYEIFENMIDACRGKTVIFISHRLSSAVIADKIYMLEKGEIIEEGSHRELMEKNGKYAEMFKMQSEKYRRDGGD
ncbi:MAG: ABC transporter ATP-binding protein [Oscillospiraceae bacterium]|nr:ABC transporter ATP-binding protein [Oscillospiraceae bacterium]